MSRGRPWRRRVAECLATYGTVCHLCHSLNCPTLYCGQHRAASTADHILPASRGGNDDLSNLRPAHECCNKKRGNRSLFWWRQRYPEFQRDGIDFFKPADSLGDTVSAGFSPGPDQNSPTGPHHDRY